MLVRCHAGCDQRDVIAALKERGLWDGKVRPSLRTSRRRRGSPLQPDYRQTGRSAVALAIWQTTIPAEDAGRNLSRVARPDRSASADASLPSWPEAPFGRDLALHGGAGDAGRRRHAAGHSPHIPRPRRPGKAPVDPAKMMLGPCRGGAVRLGEPGEVLMIGEGIETCLAAMQATGHPAWAALSTSGLRTLDLPGSVREVIVLADGDDPGEAAARTAPCAGSGRDAVSASPDLRAAWTSTTCCSAAHPASRRARNERRDRALKT